MKIGELAHARGRDRPRAAPLRQLGLLVPSERTHGGHRLYSAADVERLYRLLALRELGLPLEEIGPLLDARGRARATRCGGTRPRRAAARRARATLRQPADVAPRRARRRRAPTQHSWRPWKRCRCSRSTTRPSSSQQLEQRRQDARRRPIKAVENEWRRCTRGCADLRERGATRPSPRSQAVGDRAGELIQMFTGGDPGDRGRRCSACTSRRGRSASRGMADPADMEYMARTGRRGLAGRDPQRRPVGLQRDTASSRIARRHCGGASSHE